MHPRRHHCTGAHSKPMPQQQALKSTSPLLHHSLSLHGLNPCRSTLCCDKMLPVHAPLATVLRLLKHQRQDKQIGWPCISRRLRLQAGQQQQRSQQRLLQGVILSMVVGSLQVGVPKHPAIPSAQPLLPPTLPLLLLLVGEVLAAFLQGGEALADIVQQALCMVQGHAGWAPWRKHCQGVRACSGAAKVMTQVAQHLVHACICHGEAACMQCELCMPCELCMQLHAMRIAFVESVHAVGSACNLANF